MAQKEQDRDELLRSFLEVGVDVTADLEIEQVLLRIVERTMELTGARYGAAVTIVEGEIEEFLHRGLSPEEVALLPHLPKGHGLLGLVLEERGPIRTDRIGDHPASVGFPIKHVPMEAFLGIPLTHRGELMGALYLAKPPGAEPFSRQDEALTLALGTFAAVGIANAQLFAAEIDRSERGSLLRDIASRVRRSLDTNDVLAVTVEELGQAAEVDRCFIRLTEEDGRQLGPISFEWTAPGVESLQDDPDRQYAVGSLAAVTRMTQWTSDVLTDERREDPDLQEEMQNLLDHDVRSALAAPLEWGEDLLGVVTFHSLTPRAWTESDVDLIEGAAREVAVALHHSRLYSTAVRTADELARLDELRRDFVQMVSHELRSPMTVIGGIADLLNKRFEELPSENRKDLVDTLSRESRRLMRLVSDVLDLEAIDQGRMSTSFGRVDIAALAQESIKDAGQPERTQLVVDPGPTEITADRDRIKQIFINLLSNAFKFSSENETVDVHITPGADEVRVAVTDRGPGMSKDQIAKLFHRFSRLEQGKQPGSGLGLYLSKVLVERHGGTIWVESEEGAGSTFYFKLPAEPPR
jgi:signal transduction histidine kinase